MSLAHLCIVNQIGNRVLIFMWKKDPFCLRKQVVAWVGNLLTPALDLPAYNGRFEQYVTGCKRGSNNMFCIVCASVLFAVDCISV